MKILLVGGGGREHALAWALRAHDLLFLEKNPGFESLGRLVEGPAEGAAHREAVDLVVIGPEGPLETGLVDRLQAWGIPAFGPTRAAARLESSKIFGKEFCARHQLPAPGFRVLRPGEPFYPNGAEVVKLDGLAAGKGVWVCGDEAAVAAAVEGARRQRPEAPVLLESCISGREISILALCDGKRAVCLPPARDHKRRFDQDKGPNTGGMGAVAPVTIDESAACEAILQRAVDGMAAEGTPFRGVLYGGFMLTEKGPQLLEFNTRFGDPECQPLMMLLGEDLAPWLLGAATGMLPPGKPRFKDAHACCVVVCGQEYPEKPAHTPVEALPVDTPDCQIFHAGTRRVDGQLWAVGGRVFGVTGTGDSPETARARAYAAVTQVKFAGASVRTDIGL